MGDNTTRDNNKKKELEALIKELQKDNEKLMQLKEKNEELEQQLEIVKGEQKQFQELQEDIESTQAYQVTMTHTSLLILAQFLYWRCHFEFSSPFGLADWQSRCIRK